MKQKIFAFLLVIFLIHGMVLSVSAEQGIYVVDNAKLLTEDEESALEAVIAELKGVYHMDIVILTENSLHGIRPQDHADDYYDYNGYGEDGLLFLLSMEERDWYISTCGDARYVLTDYGIQQTADAALPYLSNGDYFDGFSVFLAELSIYLDAFSSGNPMDGYADYTGNYHHGDQEEIIYYEEPFTPSFPAALLIGLVAALTTVLIMRFSMNTKRPQRSASVYLKENSYRLSVHQDIFLYSNVSKVRRQQNQSSGGGSSVHRSSSGRSHGGGGGKF